MFAVVATLVLIGGIFNAIYSVCSRLTFCIKLKKAATSKGFTYQSKNSILLPFFKSYKGEDIVIKKGFRTIRLKFFPKMITKWFVHIEDEHKALIYKKVVLFGTNLAGRSTFHTSNGRAITGKLFERPIKIDLEFNGKNDNDIIIISPKCYEMTCIKGNAKQIVDSGYVYNKKHKFYYQKSFLDYLDRM